jgi:hypothetical protein
MTLPLELQLALDLQTALRAMRTADGYHYEPKPSSVSLDPEEILLVAETELPYFHIVFPDVSGGSRRFFPADQIRDGIPGMVLARVDVPDPQAPGAKLTAAVSLCTDLERCMAPRADRAAWHGGLAVDCRLARPLHGYGLGADPIVIVRQPFVVTTYRDYGQP